MLRPLFIFQRAGTLYGSAGLHITANNVRIHGDGSQQSILYTDYTAQYLPVCQARDVNNATNDPCGIITVLGANVTVDHLGILGNENFGGTVGTNGRGRGVYGHNASSINVIGPDELYVHDIWSARMVGETPYSDCSSNSYVDHLIQFNNNVVVNSPSNGPNTNCGGNLQTAQFLGNVCHDVDICLTPFAANTIVRDNYIDFTIRNARSGAAQIVLGGPIRGAHATVIGNEITGINSTAAAVSLIQLGDASKHPGASIISGNRIHDNFIGTETQGGAIHCQNCVGPVSIINNVITNTGRNGWGNTNPCIDLSGIALKSVMIGGNICRDGGSGRSSVEQIGVRIEVGKQRCEQCLHWPQLVWRSKPSCVHRGARRSDGFCHQRQRRPTCQTASTETVTAGSRALQARH